jgi:hypothetical protein
MMSVRAKNADTNPNNRVEQALDRLLPCVLGANARNHHHDRSRDARCDDVFGSPDQAQDNGADADQNGHAQRSKGKDQKAKKAEGEAEQSYRYSRQRRTRTLFVTETKSKDRSRDGPHAAKKFIVSRHPPHRCEDIGDYPVPEETADCERHFAANCLTDA